MKWFSSQNGDFTAIRGLFLINEHSGFFCPFSKVFTVGRGENPIFGGSTHGNRLLVTTTRGNTPDSRTIGNRVIDRMREVGEKWKNQTFVDPSGKGNVGFFVKRRNRPTWFRSSLKIPSGSAVRRTHCTQVGYTRFADRDDVSLIRIRRTEISHPHRYTGHDVFARGTVSDNTRVNNPELLFNLSTRLTVIDYVFRV